MNTERIISHTKYRLAGLLAAVALLAGMHRGRGHRRPCYLYFGEEIESLSYTVNGGSLTVEMYSNMGPWVIEPAYTSDEEGSTSGPTKATTAAASRSPSRPTTELPTR